MSKCLPGMSCWDVQVFKTYPGGCTTTECGPFSLPLSSDNLYYAGSNLPYSGVSTEDSITIALQKIDSKLVFNPSTLTPEILQALADAIAPYLP